MAKQDAPNKAKESLLKIEANARKKRKKRKKKRGGGGEGEQTTKVIKSLIRLLRVFGSLTKIP